MDLQCQDALSDARECLEMGAETKTASQLLTQVCELFGRAEEDAALEVAGEVVWVACWVTQEVPVSSLPLPYSDVVLQRSLERVLSLARERHVTRRSDLPSWAWEERSVVLQAVLTEGRALEHASDFRNDREVVLAAVRQTGWVLKYADESLRNDREVVLAAVKKDACALEYAGDFRNDREVVLVAVHHSHGRALQYADDTLRSDREVVLEAVRLSRGLALPYADETLRSDREFVREAVRLSSWGAQFADDTLKNARELLRAATAVGRSISFSAPAAGGVGAPAAPAAAGCFSAAATATTAAGGFGVPPASAASPEAGGFAFAGCSMQ